MAKKATVEGEVIVVQNNAKSVEFYSEEFVLDDTVPDIARARSIIQGGLIAERLRKTVKGYKRWRTCEVTALVDTAGKAEESELQKLLMEATALGCLPDTIDSYRRGDHKEKALRKAIDLHKERLKKVEKSNIQDMGYID
jgi:hypothetical protein